MTPIQYVGDYSPVCVVCCKPRGEGTGLHCDLHHRTWLNRFFQSCTAEARRARAQAYAIGQRRRARTIGRVCHA